MLTVDELWSLLDQTVSPLPLVDTPLADTLGRRLGEEIRADEDMPAFTRSAIDGYLLSESSEPGRYRIVGEVKPGEPVSSIPAPGEAVKIYTGSALPESGTGLVMIEDTRVEGGDVVVDVPPHQKHIRRRASQAHRGSILLTAGSSITAGTLALAATVGKDRLKISPPLRAAHLVTGSEIVPIAQTPAPGFIRDSNSVMIEALLRQAGAGRSFHAHVSEGVEPGVAQLQDIEADLFLISGGVSVGAYDGTAEILRQLGFTIHSDKVKSRPGKPLIFATRGAQVAFGLPGNPLSHFVCFHLFVRRAIARLSGLTPPSLAIVKIDGTPPPPDARETWWPARVRGVEGRLFAVPLPWRDSSDLTGLPQANALLRIGSRDGNGLVSALIFDRLEA